MPPVIKVDARGRFSIAARRFVPLAGVMRAVRFCGVLAIRLIEDGDCRLVVYLLDRSRDRCFAVIDLRSPFGFPALAGFLCRKGDPGAVAQVFDFMLH